LPGLTYENGPFDSIYKFFWDEVSGTTVSLWIVVDDLHLGVNLWSLNL